MSPAIVIALLIMEFTLWFYGSHNVEEPIQRTRNLLGTTLVCASLALLYVMSWPYSGQTPFVGLMPLYWFTLANGLVAALAASALWARRAR